MRLASDKGEHYDPKCRFHRSMFIEVIQNHLRHFSALYLKNNPYAVPVRLIPYVRDAFDSFFTDKLCYLFDQSRLVNLVRQFSNNDAVAASRLPVNPCLCPHLYQAPAVGIGINYSLCSVDNRTCREIGSLDNCHQLRNRHIRILKEHY